MATNKTVVKRVVQKTETGMITDDMDIGVDFDSVVDTRSDKGNHSLSQFFDNYVEFSENYDFMYRGTSQPTNKNAWIGMDTNQNNYSN